MKKGILIFSLLLLWSTKNTAQESDYKTIESVIKTYVVGDNTRNYKMLEGIFHEGTTMKTFSLKANEYREYNCLDVFKSQENADQQKERNHRISFINIAGNAAMAKLETEYPKGFNADYFTLLKIDGNWKIVSKVYAFVKKEENE
ncbi:hypothetical protein HME9304_01408 [Flagellimonas maritima]|uniref:Nuclear transport factor 2 family protein n=1 Tax=Flagellimonas maritima TaxID=1383885 RepID=A0A2Z4LST1_9FLAO|nr:nuclear transport factor 2 family protein [Allomuricauda aurantiaca]AWX44408.1 hypothetical protein HME9304_01408 [Allomuricauda aurantiaca]